MSTFLGKKELKKHREGLLRRVKKFTDTPGVYFFKGGGGKILYIGRATSLKDRVKSYFGKDLITTRGELLVQMVDEAKSIDAVPTDSVLEAIILEANLIKKHRPLYNSRDKDDKSYNYLVITREDFPRVLIVRGKDLDTMFKASELKYVFGPFPHGGLFKEAVKIVRRIFPFRDKCMPGGKRPCFNAQIGLCPGVCSGAVSTVQYGKTMQHLRLFFEGKKSAIVRQLKKEMREYVRIEAFEEADEVKRKLFALEHIQDVTLIKREVRDLPRAGSVFRIEAYDVAHMGGQYAVGVMTVVEDGEVKKSDYRKFKIRGGEAGNDIAALKEVLTRRFNHTEWRLPNLLVLDGGTAQLNAAREVLREFGYQIPSVSVVKNERHQPRDFMGDRSFVREHQASILLGNSEAHRFAIGWHRSRRERDFIPT
jgi:excinuclease ABC subunit C